MVACEALIRCRISELDAHSEIERFALLSGGEYVGWVQISAGGFRGIFGHAPSSHVEQFAGADIPHERLYSCPGQRGGTPLSSVTLGV